MLQGNKLQKIFVTVSRSRIQWRVTRYVELFKKILHVLECDGVRQTMLPCYNGN